MSASAMRYVKAGFDAGLESEVPVRHHHGLHLVDKVERCECGRRLMLGQHELCPQCDAAALDALPLQEVRV